MVRRREVQPSNRSANVSDEEYLGAAETKWDREADVSTMTVEERLEHRDKQGPKRSLMPIYGNEEHKNLIDAAAKITGLSKQKLIRKVLYEGLEREFGKNVPFLKDS